MELKLVYREINWQLKARENHTTSERLAYEHEQNSVLDRIQNNILIQRRYYGSTGEPRLDVNMTDHGNSKTHPIVSHYHDWE